jgi:hypothetical protein
MTSTQHFKDQSKCVSNFNPTLQNFELGIRHRLRTQGCPSIPILTARRFTADQRAHVENCAYCTKVLRMSKRSWFSEVRTWARVYSDSRTAVLAMRFVYVAALVVVVGFSVISQKQIGRVQDSVQLVGAQQAGIGIGLQELRANLIHPAPYRTQSASGDGRIEAFAIQQRELAKNDRRLHQDLLVEQQQIKALAEANEDLRLELANVALELSSYPPTTKSVDSSVAVSEDPAIQERLRWTIFELAKTSKGTSELSWIALPTGKEGSIGISESRKETSVTAVVPSTAVFTRALTSMPVEIKGEREGDGIRIHAIRFLPEATTSAHPTVDPGIVIGIK